MNNITLEAARDFVHVMHIRNMVTKYCKALIIGLLVATAVCSYKPYLTIFFLQHKRADFSL